jgi:hypothetical protein
VFGKLDGDSNTDYKSLAYLQVPGSRLMIEYNGVRFEPNDHCILSMHRQDVGVDGPQLPDEPAFPKLSAPV